MTKVHLQPGLRGLSGGMGDWVYSMRNGKTVLGMKPIRTAEPTEAQLAHRERFKEAVSFAKTARANPTLRAFYQQIAMVKGINIYALAIADFLNSPEFEYVDFASYKGRVGDPITIKANDDLGMAYVNVKISAQNGTLIESGQAVEQGTGSGKWIYTATTTIALGTDIFIEATGADHANTEVQISANPKVGDAE